MRQFGCQCVGVWIWKARLGRAHLHRPAGRQLDVNLGKSAHGADDLFSVAQGGQTIESLVLETRQIMIATPEEDQPQPTFAEVTHTACARLYADSNHYITPRAPSTNEGLLTVRDGRSVDDFADFHMIAEETVFRKFEIGG